MRCQFYVVTAQTQSGVSAILALNAQKMAETAEAAANLSMQQTSPVEQKAASRLKSSRAALQGRLLPDAANRRCDNADGTMSDRNRSRRYPAAACSRPAQDRLFRLRSWRCTLRHLISLRVHAFQVREIVSLLYVQLWR